jgi:branched-chain amino acid transport system ATP-binding protein
LSALLEVEALEAAYGGAKVLFGVSLALNKGEVVALVGSNGAGKSTTLKAIMGLVTPSAGVVRLGGMPVTGWAPFQIARAGLGYVPEDRRIFTDLTVAENLEVGKRPAPDGAEPWTLEKIFRIFPNLAGMLPRQASAMSGGEQQMLAIARTLMGNPSAILLDEASEGLAPVIVELMVKAVLRMKHEGVALLLAENYPAFTRAVADRLYVIERGVTRPAALDALQAN